MRFRGTDTVVLIRAPLVTDEYGTADSARDWGAATETSIAGCVVQPIPGGEYELGREAVITRWRLFVPPDTAMEATDRVRWQGDVYEIEGRPMVWSGRFVEAILRRVAG